MRKTTFLLLSILFFGPVNSFAQVDSSDPFSFSDDHVLGPVKQMTIVETVKGVRVIKVRQYNSQGRMINYEKYSNDNLSFGVLRQERDSNAYFVDYDSTRCIEDGNYRLSYYNHLCHAYVRKYHKGGCLYRIDSVICNSYGKKVKEYMKHPKESDVFVLCATYEYDSLLRLVDVYRNPFDERLTATYLSNGNFKVVRKSNYRNDTEKKTYKVNSNGQLMEINEDDTDYTFYSEYDEYGNWHNKKQVHEGETYKKIKYSTRIIEYYSPEESDSIYLSAEQQPEFSGGQKAMFKFIADNIVCPSSVQEKGYQGRAYCQFVVNKSGDLADIVVAKSCGNEDLDREAIRVITSMPKWKPGRNAGDNVRVKYTIPVSFKIAAAQNIRKKQIIVQEKGIDTALTLAEVMPMFPGGRQALYKYLSDNVRYPNKALRNAKQGSTMCQFVIDIDGSITNVRVLRSSGDVSLDAEAVRVVKSMPKWSIGMINGKPVRVKYMVPINFILSDDYKYNPNPKAWHTPYDL